MRMLKYIFSLPSSRGLSISRRPAACPRDPLVCDGSRGQAAGRRSSANKSGGRRPTFKWFGYSYMGLIYFFLYCPILVLIIFSLNDSQYSSLWHGFSWNWYQQLWQDTILLTAAKNSLFLGIAASSLATIIGAISAVALFYFRFKGNKLLHGLLMVMILSPDIILGISLLLFFSITKVPLGFTSLVIAHITFCLPFVIVTLYSRLVDTDKNIIEAAKDLGASDMQIFFKILIPLLRPALIASWLISFTLSIDDIVISFFVSGPSFQILPLAIYSSIRAGVTPELNALCTLMFAATLIIVLTAVTLLRKRSMLETLL